MNLVRNRRYWLPIILGLLGLLLLLRVLLADGFVLVPEDVDVVVLVALLSLAMVAAIHRIVGISMNQLRRHTTRQLRAETLAEHGRFLSRLDHELKNPLTTLRSGLKTLELTGLDEQQRHLVTTLETATLRLSRLVTALRKLGELERQPLNLQPVNIATLVTNLLHLETERFAGGERQLTGTVEVTQPLWVIDEDLIALAIHNLLDNAFKYSRPGATVELRVSEQEELVIQVSDSGIGIPAEALPHLWEELYRAHPEKKIPGSGAGLALVKAIVKRHEGTAEIESERGVGTTVTLRLPSVSQI